MNQLYLLMLNLKRNYQQFGVECSALLTYYCRSRFGDRPTDGFLMVGGNSDSRPFQDHQLALD